MDLRPKGLPFEPGSLPGLSEKLLCSHHQNNYRGAVERLNAIRAQLAGLDYGIAPGFQINGLKQEELIATNSMVLHELYFGSMGGAGAAMAPGMTLALEANFGSVEHWRTEFVAMGKALAGNSGWVLLVFRPRDGRLVHQRSAEYSQAVAGGVPILALAMDEHAHHIDFGAAAGDYVDAFMGHIHWAAVYERYQAAVHGAGDALGATQDAVARAAVVVDVRRAGVYEQSSTTLPGARWLNPATVDQWAGELPTDQAVLVYCAYGHEVGRSTALRLQAAGIQAHFLLGGIDAWARAGRPLTSKNTSFCT